MLISMLRVNVFQRVNRRLARQLSFFNSGNSVYLDEMYKCWRNDPSSVHSSWNAIFSAQAKGLNLNDVYTSPKIMSNQPTSNFAKTTSASAPQNVVDAASVDEHLAVYQLVKAYQDYGHFYAELDPLKITAPPKNDFLDIRRYNLNESHLNKTFHLSSLNLNLNKNATLSEIIAQLKKVYCGGIGVEFSHLTDLNAIQFIKDAMESRNTRFPIDANSQQLSLTRLVRASMFERFLARKFASEKRFGLEGCESLIPLLKTVIDESSNLNVDSFILGTPHRGRLNLLANVCRMPLNEIFSRFNSELNANDEGAGDVKYHLGMSHKWTNHATGKVINISIVANPSHLEAVAPVAQGKTRAEQQMLNNDQAAMCILLHGDAAFAGQGVVYETMHLGNLPSYTTQGAVHVVVNNQVGFTTDPRYSRSSYYCTDVSKVVNAPIFHVNADDVDSVMFVGQLAAEYRNKFRSDVVIDLIGYRKNGHNEADNPSFTQPLMYKKIGRIQPVLEQYTKKLVDNQILTKDFIDQYIDSYESILNEGFDASQKMTCYDNHIWLDSPYMQVESKKSVDKTGVDKNTLKEIMMKVNEIKNIDPDFTMHRNLSKIMEQRKNMIENNTVDWALGEICAFGSLLSEGVHVRLSGQDVERGTFSHRHHVLHDQQRDGVRLTPLNYIAANNNKYSVSNSSLSEYAVLGFDLGYSLANKNSLVCWEAQFGDFANGAQIIIDQFLSSGYTKWLRQTGLVMLLPHGYDGMGPEHSSARLERFLQLSAADDTELDQNTFEQIKSKNASFVEKQLFDTNWFVVNCTTPANIFHVLRRQVKMNFRRPLIVMSPKNLLRLEAAKSNLTEMDSNTEFQRLIPDNYKNKHTKRVILCSGKVFYELDTFRKNLPNKDDYEILRVEQLVPLPYDLLAEQFDQRQSNTSFVWVQEEPKNQGAWTYVQPRLNSLLKKLNQTNEMVYVGREFSATTACGSKKTHVTEQETLIRRAFN